MLGGAFSWLLRRRETACGRCPHDRGSHPPYDPRTGKPGFCESCRCAQWRPERPWALVLAFLRERPEPVQADVLHQHPVRYPVPARRDEDDRTQFGLRVPPWVFLPRDDRRAER